MIPLKFTILPSKSKYIRSAKTTNCISHAHDMPWWLRLSDAWQFVVFINVNSCCKSRKFFCLFLFLGQDVKCLLFWMLTEWRQTGRMAPAASPAPAEVSPYQIFSLCVNFEFSFLHKLELEDIDILQRTNATLREDKIIIIHIWLWGQQMRLILIICVLQNSSPFRNILHVDQPDASLYSLSLF